MESEHDHHQRGVKRGTSVAFGGDDVATISSLSHYTTTAVIGNSHSSSAIAPGPSNLWEKLEVPESVDLVPNFLETEPTTLPEDWQGLETIQTTLLENTKTLRDSLVFDLRNQQDSDTPYNLAFLDSASLGAPNELYSETTLTEIFLELASSDLFRDIYRANGEAQRRLEKCLPFVNTAKPKLPMLCASGRNLVFVEFEHPTDNVENGSHRCLLYMYAFLYWMRCKLGIPVSHVYGAVVVMDGRLGSSKRDTKTYGVGLLKLTAPQCLGQPLRPEAYWSIQSMENPRGFHLLMHFLHHVPGLAMGERRERVLPALLHLPSHLWQNTDERQLIQNGTLPAVFRVTAKGFKELLGSIDDGFCTLSLNPALAGWLKFTEYMCKVEKEVLGAETDSTGEGGEWYYLKILTVDKENNYVPSYLNDLWDKLQDQPQVVQDEFYGTYPVRPFCAGYFHLIVMKDRGDTLVDELPFHSLADVVGAFRRLKDFVQVLSDSDFTHGDLQLHNMTVETPNGSGAPSRPGQTKIHLIDLDEGTRNDSVTKRRDANGCAYSNALRYNGEKYSVLQLASSLHLVAKHYVTTRHEQERVLELGKTIDGMDYFLELRDRDYYYGKGDQGMDEILDKFYDWVVTAMKWLLDFESDSTKRYATRRKPGFYKL